MKIHKKINYTTLRCSAYDSVGDQLDRITKVIKHLQAQGIDIGEAGEQQVLMVDAVKNKFKKD